MPNIIRTDRTYATVANALRALGIALDRFNLKSIDVRWCIAVANDGRYAPIVFGVEHLPLIHHGITVSA